MLRPAEPLLPASLCLKHWDEKIHKGAEVLASLDFGQLNHGLVSHWNQPEELVRGQSGKDGFFIRKFGEMRAGHAVERMMATEGVTYLPDDILTKVDRASMAVSLEAHAPFLGNRVVEFAWRSPLNWKMQVNATKVMLRKPWKIRTPQPHRASQNGIRCSHRRVAARSPEGTGRGFAFTLESQSR